jgi:S1-C subfamily serine protease
MGIDDVAVLLPVDAGADCVTLEAGLADAVFVTQAPADIGPAPRPRLGVSIENADDGVRVMEVVANSVADQSGLQAGDIILRAAGFDTATTGALIEVIQRQAPGTWLPLAVRRDKRELEVVARFPQDFE